jgi:YHS domain-containing protein
MKKNTLKILLAVGAFGGVALTTKLAAADGAMPSCTGMTGGCCGGLTMPMANAVSTSDSPDMLTTCPVSGEKLGEMGKPFTFEYKDQEVKLCCKGCKKDFDKNPEKYLQLIRAADKK